MLLSNTHFNADLNRPVVKTGKLTSFYRLGLRALFQDPDRLLLAHLRGIARLLIVNAALASLALSSATSSAEATAPLYDPVILNIGIMCQWQQSCEKRQLKAMRQANKFLARSNPAMWRIHMCNKNARRGAASADWIGFNACIRNAALLPPPPPPQPRRRARRHH